MSSGIHCDGPTCDTWAKSGMATGESGFLTVFDGVYPMYAEFVAHFCSWDCLMKYASFKESLTQMDF